MKIAGVYRIKNLLNEKVYIGSSVNVKKRIDTHKKQLCQNKHGNRYLQRAFNKYGAENFSFETIREISFKDKNIELFKQHLLSNEQIYMDLYESYNPEKGYNISPIAGSTLGTTHSEESKARMRLAHLGENNHQLGKKRSEEAKEKNRLAHIGKTHSAETKAKMRLAHLGKKRSSYRKTWLKKFIQLLEISK